jgi:hypothetical protein
MARRSKVKSTRPSDATVLAQPEEEGSAVAEPVSLVASPLPRNVVLASVIIRNLLAVVGVFFWGWSAPELIVLYFVDTLAIMWGIFTGVMFALFQSERTTLSDRLYWWATALALSAFVVAFISIPLGMPVLFVSAMSSWRPAEALANQGFWLALGLIVLAGLGGAAWRSIQAAEGEEGMRWLKWEFGLVFGRWFVVMAVMYFVGFTLGFIIPGGAAAVMVIVYAAASTITELYPERFVRWIEGRGGGGLKGT